MAFFWYKAFSRDGKQTTGIIESESVQKVRETLVERGLYVVTITVQEAEGGGRKGIIASLFEPVVSLKDRIFFTKQLALLLKSGIPLAEAINLMISQSPPYMREMLTFMRNELREGKSFASALAAYPKSFSSLYIQLIKAGEASGQMEKVLLRLAAFSDEQDKFQKAVSGALQGPLIQLALIFGVAGFLLTLIVPKIADVFSSMGDKKLPALTRAVLALSDALLHNYIAIALVVGSVIITYQLWRQSDHGKLTFDIIKLKIPLIKYFTRTEAVVQFSQTLGLLLESGVNIAEALDIVVQVVENQILVEALRKAKENIIKQGKVTEYLQKTKLFSPVDIHLIGTGEQTGALDVMLNQVGSYNQDDLQQFAQGLTALLNPLSMVVLAVVVGTIIFAIMAPLMNMSSMMEGK